MLTLPAPGPLTIGKLVTADEGLTAPDDASFTFELTVPELASQTVQATLQTVSPDGTAETPQKLEFDEDGKVSFSLMNNQLIIIPGLVDGIDYTLVETDIPDGFKLNQVVGATLGTDGKITGTTTEADDLVMVGNHYSVTPIDKHPSTDLGVAGTKTLEGRDFKEGDSFTFTIAANSATADAPLPQDSAGTQVTSVTITPTSGSTAAWSFGDGVKITYKLPGTYQYDITEAIPSTPIPGVTYDTTKYRLTVKVVDNGDGTLSETHKLERYDTETSAYVAADDGSADFTNTYQPGGDTSVTFANLKKVLSGKVWDGDEFTFKLSRVSPADAPLPTAMTVTVSAPDVAGGNEATFGFGPIIFDAAGVYKYQVTEVAGSNSGMSYDSHAATVTITVVDNLNGGYSASVQVENGTFTNTYGTTVQYDDLDGGIWLKKTMTNQDLTDGEFTFVAKPKDQASADKAGIPLTGKSYTNSAVTMTGTEASNLFKILPDMVFTQADNGKKYEFTVTETAGSTAGITYDATVYTITITVTDDMNGTLTVDSTVVHNSQTDYYTYTNKDTKRTPIILLFKNKYNGEGYLNGEGNTQILAEKQLENRKLKANEFSFNVKNSVDDSVVATGTNAADGSVAFSKITYTSDSLNKDVAEGKCVKAVDATDGTTQYTYTYTVEEDTTSLPAGVSPVTTSYTISVVVVDDGSGTFDVSVTYPDDLSSLTFTNTYGADSAASVTVAGTKLLTSEEPSATLPDITGKYTFTLSAEAGTPMPLSTTATNDAAGNVSFGKIGFTVDDVKDVTPDASGKRTKVFTYKVTESGTVAGVTNDAAQTFTITVVDDGEGNITATANPATTQFKFTNTYSIKPAEVTIDVPVNKDLEGRDLAPGEFSFKLTDAEGDTVATGTNDAAGHVDFGTISFTKPGTYTYNLSEVSGSLGGVTYDTTVYKVTVVVTDDPDGDGSGNGELTVTWLISNTDGDAVKTADFHNSYKPQSTSVVLAANKVLDGRPLSAGEFGFVLKEGITQLQEKTNDASGAVSFDPIVFDKAGEYTYTISEVTGALEGVTYDMSTFTATVTVKDDGEGHLNATVAYDATPTFKNTYKEIIPEPGFADLKAQKVLKGRKLQDQEFTFVLADQAGTTLQEKKNDKDGSVTFDTLKFTKAGTYTFTITEQVGSEAGMTYDQSVHTVTVTVTDNGKHQLVADVNYADKPVFKNVYKKPTPGKTKVELSAFKVLEGRTLAKNEFSFRLVDASFKTVQEKKNDKSGNVTFDELVFDKAGAYKYYIAEVKGTDADITYDTTVHTVVITVTDDGTGKLSAQVAYDKGKAVFTNTYKTPHTPYTPAEPPVTPPTYIIPKTSDDATTFALGALLAAAGIVALGVGFGRRLKRG